MKIFNVVITIILVVFLTGCNPNIQTETSNKVEVPLPNNVSSKRIYLRDITTGQILIEENLPGITEIGPNAVLFYYSYFGEMRSFTATRNEDKKILSYEFLMSEDVASLHAAIEDKISNESSKEVRFRCKTEPFNIGKIDYLKRTCEIKYEYQILSTVENSLLTEKPDYIEFKDWSAMYLATQFTLKESGIELAMETKRKIQNDADRARESSEAEKLSAKKDL